MVLVNPGALPSGYNSRHVALALALLNGGAAGSVQTQAASNVGFLNQLQGLDQARFSNLQAAAREEGRAASLQGLGKGTSTLLTGTGRWLENR